MRWSDGDGLEGRKSAKRKSSPRLLDIEGPLMNVATSDGGKAENKFQVGLQTWALVLYHLQVGKPPTLDDWFSNLVSFSCCKTSDPRQVLNIWMFGS